MLILLDCYDVVSKVTMGFPLGFMDGDGRDAYDLIKAVKAFGKYARLASQMPWLHTIFVNNPIMSRVKPSPFSQVVEGAVIDRLEGSEPRSSHHPDLLSHFATTHGIYPEIMDAKQVTIFTSSNLIAGGFSPGSTFDTLCRFLVKNPDAQDKLFEELQAAQKLTFAPFDDLKHLPYLEGVVREAERLHIRSSFTLQRVASPAGLTLPNGVHIPAGTKVGCPPEAINSDVGIFGSDAREYKPERWAKQTGEDDKAFEVRRNLMERTELSFGQGSRACIGKSIWRLEVFKVLAALLARFKVCLLTRQSELSLTR